MAQANAAQDRVRALEAQLRDMEAQQTERGLLVTLGDVLFAFNKAELSAQAAPRLDKLANFLKQFPDRKLLIEGYTDSVGGDRYNQDLSDRRAQAERDALEGLADGCVLSQQLEVAADLGAHQQPLLGVELGLQRLRVAGHQRQGAGQHGFDAGQLVLFGEVSIGQGHRRSPWGASSCK